MLVLNERLIGVRVLLAKHRAVSHPRIEQKLPLSRRLQYSIFAVFSAAKDFTNGNMHAMYSVNDARDQSICDSAVVGLTGGSLAAMVKRDEETKQRSRFRASCLRVSSAMEGQNMAEILAGLAVFSDIPSS